MICYFSSEPGSEKQISWLGKKEQIFEILFWGIKHKNNQEIKENYLFKQIADIWNLFVGCVWQNN